ncbi:MAG: hypothetical protein U1E17_07850 [Geminicoccaceae bacterium]
MSALKLKELRTFPPEADQEEVARAFHRYGLVTAPVVAGDGGLGQITIDDVVDVIDEEAEDDILKLGGVSEDDTYVPATRTPAQPHALARGQPVHRRVRCQRDRPFRGHAGKGLAALAARQPMVAGMAGNAGTQALTVTVRALAAGEITAAGTAGAPGAQGAGRACSTAWAFSCSARPSRSPGSAS